MALNDYTAGAASLPMDGAGKHFIIKNLIDCYTSVANGGFGTWVSTDTARAIELKEGWLVRRVWVRLVKIGTIGATVLTDVGDSVVGAASFIATNMDIGTTGTLNQVKGSVIGDTTEAAGGYLCLADNYVLLTISTASFDGKLEIAAEIIDVFGGDTIV
jgi:hypothetical protein